MPDGEGESVTSQIQEAEAQADELLDSIRHLNGSLDAFQAEPLLDYDRRLSEIEAGISEATDGLRLGPAELDQVERHSRILRRLKTAIGSQLAIHRRAIEQQLDYLAQWVNHLEDFERNVEATDSTNFRPGSELTGLTGWVESARQYVNADRHTELRSSDGTHSLQQLKEQIEDFEDEVRDLVSESAEISYLKDRLEAEIEYYELVIDRIEDADTTIESFPIDGHRPKQCVSEVDSLDERIADIQDVRSTAIAHANRVEETAGIIDALRNRGFRYEGMEDHCSDIEDTLQEGNVDTARRQVVKLLEGENALDPIDRFELKLSEYDGDVIAVLEETEHSADEVFEHFSELYSRGVVEEMRVSLT
jgi:chromosome segregation ATPase